jgi:osmoprotectant transport system ATP-binding protein
MIRLDSVSKIFPDGHVAVDALSLEIPEGEICVLVGPSGCGKTTTLRMINRLIEPTSGRIFLDGEDVTEADPVQLRRRIGYVIQQVGLFPHQTIAENIGTVPRLLGWDRARVRARVDELLTMVGLEPARYRRRYPHQLSGGQRQRVGVARALGADPPVLLMDEPFGAIDPITRDRLQHQFLRLQHELRKTVVFVTHDIEEAVKLGDRIAILADGGHLAQYDTPNELLGHPASPFVAEFVGSDRGLKRLEVTGIDRAALATPPVVHAGTSAAEARARINGQAPPIAIVVDDDGRLEGWVAKDSELSGGNGIRPFDGTATVPADGSLKDALAALLLADTGWVAVVDAEDRYVGVATPDTVHLATRAT